MISSATSRVFADWLDTTFPPESDIPDQLCQLVSSSGGQGSPLPKGGVLYRFPDGGTFTVDTTRRLWARASASGAALAHMRAHGIFMEYLGIIATGAHRITRLDAAHDVSADAADVLAKLKRRYRGGKRVHLTRKGLPPSLLTRYRETDGRESGTFYAGRRTKARVTARVYDKALERWDNAMEVIDPLTRYELTVKADVGATLRDAAEPDSLFWHFMSPSLLKAPGDQLPWVPDSEFGWRADLPERNPLSLIERKIEDSIEIIDLCRLADLLGPEGRTLLKRKLADRVASCPSLCD